MRRAMKGIVTLAVFLTIAAPAAAASIHGNLLSFVAGPDNSSANGGGTLEGVFGAAALYWELALLDNVDVVIDYFWDFNSGALAASAGDSCMPPKRRAEDVESPAPQPGFPTRNFSDRILVTVRG